MQLLPVNNKSIDYISLTLRVIYKFEIGYNNLPDKENEVTLQKLSTNNIFAL